jgi:hypothetical protein
MSKQTAVEWLEFEINRRGPKENNPPKWIKELYEQAKEMEKEQILFAYNDGAMGAFEKTYKGMHDYFIENYGGSDDN